MSWFPQDVDTNAGGKYLNIKKAPLGREVRFRILGDPINGYLAWGKKRDVQGAKDMPLRWRRGDKAPRGYVYQVDMQTGELRAPQQFVAFPVWDYAGKRVRVMELTQVTILKMLKAYADSPDWGHTWTARCRVCDWAAPRLALGPACEAALDHEARTAQEARS